MADISRAEALALINQQNGTEIFQEAAKFSVALATFRQQRMSSKQTRMPVLDALPTAGFINGDTGQKPTSEMAWANKMIEAEEIAVIVPIPENVFDDASFDIWAEVKPRIAEAVGVTIDKAVFFGTGAPASWPTGLVPGAIAAGNVVDRSVIQTGPPVADLAEVYNQLLAVVEADGFDPNVIWTTRQQRTALRGLRDLNGQPLFVTTLGAGGATSEVYGVPISWVNNSAWAYATAQALTGDRNMAILATRQDMTFKILTEATLTDGAGNVTFSLAEQDMIALRCKMRVGFQVADPTTLEGGTAAYPFAAMVP